MLVAQLAVTVGCSENLYEGTSRKTACDVVSSGPVWWLMVLVPALAVFLVLGLVKPPASWAGAAVIVGITATVEAVLLAVVSSVLFA